MTRTRRLLAGVLLSGALYATATAQPAPSPQGDWVTEGGWATVRIAPCPSDAGRLCGRIIGLKEPTDGRGRPKRDTANADPKLRSRLVVGMPFVTGFKPAGPGRWTGGKIYNPGDGKTYNARLALNPDGSLRVNGCVLVICQGQTWTRTAS
jgi:uncharacterized protein (DUF2147 family)